MSRLFRDPEDLDFLEKPFSDALAGDAGDLVYGDMDDPAFIGIHEIQDFVLSGIGDLLGNSLGPLRARSC